VKTIAEITSDTITPEEMAAITGASLGSIYGAIKQKQIPVLEIGRLKKIPTRWLRQKLLADEAGRAA
jgi:excisionase family DNA binding protein